MLTYFYCNIFIDFMKGISQQIKFFFSTKDTLLASIRIPKPLSISIKYSSSTNSSEFSLLEISPRKIILLPPRDTESFSNEGKLRNIRYSLINMIQLTLIRGLSSEKGIPLSFKSSNEGNLKKKRRST